VVKATRFGYGLTRGVSKSQGLEKNAWLLIHALVGNLRVVPEPRFGGLHPRGGVRSPWRKEHAWC